MIVCEPASDISGRFGVKGVYQFLPSICYYCELLQYCILFNMVLRNMLFEIH